MAEHENERRFSAIPNKDAVSGALAFLDSCAEEFAVPMRTGYSLNVITDEIFSNIVYYSGASNAELLFRNDADSITLVFTDDGVPYDPTAAEEPDITAGAEERAIGGLGLLMVKKMAERVEYAYTAQRNQLTVIVSKTAKKRKLSLEDL